MKILLLCVAISCSLFASEVRYSCNSDLIEIAKEEKVSPFGEVETRYNIYFMYRMIVSNAFINTKIVENYRSKTRYNTLLTLSDCEAMDSNSCSYYAELNVETLRGTIKIQDSINSLDCVLKKQ